MNNKILIAARVWSVIWTLLLFVPLTHRSEPDVIGALICVAIAALPWATIWAIYGKLR